MRRLNFFYGLCVSLLILAGCQNQMSIEGESQSLGSPEVGTNVGNPVSELTASFALAEAPVRDEASRCGRVEIESAVLTRAPRMECSLTPEVLGFGVMRTHALLGPLAQLKTDPAAAVQLSLYSGELVPIEITAQETVFPKPFNDVIAGEAKSIVGLHWILAYLDFVLPDSDMVAEHWRNVSCRICLVDYKAELEDDAIAADICGDAAAPRGSVRCDVNGDGVIGFIDPTKMTAISAEESVTLPETYLAYNRPELKGMIGDFLQENLVATGLEVEGGFPFTSLAVPLAAAESLEPGNKYNFALSIPIAHSLRFYAKQSPDVYNVFHHGLPRFKLAAPTLTLEEK